MLFLSMCAFSTIWSSLNRAGFVFMFAEKFSYGIRICDLRFNLGKIATYNLLI